MLMMKCSVKWVPYDPSESYKLVRAFPETPLHTRMNNRNIAQVAVCNGCMNPKTRRFPPLLKKVPIEIKNVPMRHRRYLTPVHMNCSLGRAIGSNPYTNYRHLHGTIGITHNHRTLELYSGMVRAFLNVNEPLTWFHDTLTPASEWLKNNNPLLKKYASNVVISNPLPEDTVPIQFPLARQTIDSHEHTFNMHRCDQRCGGQGPNGEPCSKGFPQPLSRETYCSPNSLRYVYRRTKEEDRMIVPYHPETLIIWNGHINFQYVTSTGFARYITKYVTKAEPSELFDIDETEKYQKHVTARRLGAMDTI
ncbi:4651_t:CDS:2 [Entrophospora sp. SA101]|nr:4651_t:CDS:2 [Entrophospora sp. SA101]